MADAASQSTSGRGFQFLTKQAISLLGEFVPNDEFKTLAGNVQKTGYHSKFQPSDIRRVREALTPGLADFLKSRGRPPVICVHTSKGGTGKSAVATNLSVALAMQGWRVAFIDGDPASSGATELLNCQNDTDDLVTLRDVMDGKVTPEKAFLRIYDNAELFLLPADPGMGRMEIELVSKIGRETLFSEHLKKHSDFYSGFDFIIIDTSPNTTLLNFNFLFAANLIVSPLKLDGAAIKAMRSLQHNLNDIARLTNMEPQVMLVPNAYHAGMTHSIENLALVRDAYPENLSKTVIPTYAGFERQIRIWENWTRPLVESEMSSTASKAIMAVTRELVAKFVTTPLERTRNAKR